MDIAALVPEIVWGHFQTICRIPHPSGYEAALINHIQEFAEKLNLSTWVDPVGNLLVKKPATLEDHKGITVALQAHVDMVPQKNADKIHDFTRDPIELVSDGAWLRANCTTLGADNGIGVAAIMAILESKQIKHGPLEAVFTVNEEAGMDGAFGLEPGVLEAAVLLNLDSEDEGELFIGCAGGVDVLVQKPAKALECREGCCVDLQIGGLKGGHSGLDIHLGRGNANRILLQVIRNLVRQLPVQLVRFKGGNLLNAIPREAEAVLWLPENHLSLLKTALEHQQHALQEHFCGTDPNIALQWSVGVPEVPVLAVAEFPRLIDAVLACPFGVLAFSEMQPRVVHSSNNISVVEMDSQKFEVKMLLRNASVDDREKYKVEIAGCFRNIDAVTTFEGEYPGWMPNYGSRILRQAQQVYEQLYGLKPQVKVIHAGLECGIIGAGYPNMEMLSFGPTIRFPHSPDERLEVASVARFWNYLIALLEHLAKER